MNDDETDITLRMVENEKRRQEFDMQDTNYERPIKHDYGDYCDTFVARRFSPANHPYVKELLRRNEAKHAMELENGQSIGNGAGSRNSNGYDEID